MLLPFFVALSFSASASPMRVVIDPGHGGHDAGATRGRLNEAKIVLNISRFLKKYLQEDPRFQVFMTRNSAKFVRLSHRAKMANNKTADLFISIHANASPDPRARGLEVYFQNQLPPDEESMYLANLEHEGHSEVDRYSERDELQGLRIPAETTPEVKNILKDLIRSHRIRESSFMAQNIVEHWTGSRKARQHSILQAPFFVVSNVNMPSVLVEVGFVSNKKDAGNLASSTYQKSIAKNLYRSILNYSQKASKN